MPDVEIVWFSEKLALLATRHSDIYSINGAWDWKNYTREEFNQLFPDFGY